MDGSNYAHDRIVAGIGAVMEDGEDGGDGGRRTSWVIGGLHTTCPPAVALFPLLDGFRIISTWTKHQMSGEELSPTGASDEY